MSRDSKSFLDSLVLGDSEKGVVVTGITDDTVTRKSGIQAGDELALATINLNNLNKNEVLSILKVLEPYESNMTVLTKKDLSASAGLGSLGLGLKDSAEILQDKDLSLKAPTVSFDAPNGRLNTTKGLGGGVSGPTLNGDLPSLSLNKPSADAGAKIKLPSAELTRPDMKADVGGTFKAPDVSVSTPQLNTPKASLDIEKPQIKTGNTKYKAPNFTMPHFNLPQIKTPKADVSGDVDIPSVSGNIKTPDLNMSAPEFGLHNPDLDLNGPKVDLNGPDLNFKTPNADIEAPSGSVRWPWKVKGPKVKGPDANLNGDIDADLSAPNVSLSTPKIDGDLSVPDVDLPKADIGTPDLDINGHSGKIHWPHLDWKIPKIHGRKADLDANLDTPDVDVNLPKAHLKGPDVDVESPNIDVDAPSGKINWPHLKLKKPKLHGKADVDADLKAPDLNLSGPDLKGDINVPNAELNLPNADLNGPHMDVKAPDLDIDAPSGKVNWPHLKWKKPKLHGIKTDADLNADLSTPDVDLSGLKIDGDMSTPDVDLNLPKADVDLKAPDADIKAPSGHIKFPTLKKPKFMISKPKVKTPDADLNADVKTPDLSLAQPSIDGPDIDLKLPKAGVDVDTPNVDVEAPSGKFKWPTIKKPKWAVAGPTVNGPEVDLDADVSAPQLNLSAPEIDGKINAPDVNLENPKLDINSPDVDIEGPNSKFKWFNLKKPKGGTLKGPKADIDADMKVPNVDIKGPDGDLNISGIEAPDLNADISGPNVDLNGPDLDAPDAKLKFPKFNLPKFRGLNVGAPDADASLDLPKVKAPDLSLSGVKGGFDAPDLDADLPKADLKSPDVNIEAPDVDASTGKFKLPKMNFPDFGFSGPRGKRPNLDADFKGPDLNLSPDLDLDLPKTDVKGPSLGLPKADLQGPDLRFNAPDLNVSSPGIGGNLSAPNIDTKFPKAELEGPDLTMKSPNVDINLPKGDLEGPKAQLKTPNLDTHLGDFKLPHFKNPKLDFSGPEVDVPSVHPSAEAGIKAPRVNIGTSKADANVSVPAVDLKSPQLEGDLKGPKVDLKAPDVDANHEKSKFPHLKLPKMNFLGSKIKSPEVNALADAHLDAGSGADWETNADMDVPPFKVHKLPTTAIDGIGGIDDALGLSKFDTEAKDYVVSKGIRLPVVNATSKPGGKIDIMERLRMAREKIPSADVSPTDDKADIDLKLATPSLKVGASTEAGDQSLVRGGTFKVDKPESALGLVAPEISTSDENDKMSLSLSNMLGLNVKD